MLEPTDRLTPTARILTALWLSVLLVEFAIWLIISIVGGLTSAWWLWTLAGGGATVGGFHVFVRSEKAADRYRGCYLARLSPKCAQDVVGQLTATTAPEVCPAERPSSEERTPCSKNCAEKLARALPNPRPVPGGVPPCQLTGAHRQKQACEPSCG
jgi:hypothetical protein